MNARIIVVGAGHAGLEAAFAGLRIGVEVIVITGRLDTVGQTPCNPSVGGIAKGHLVHEIEALGGFMGRAADGCAIHGRILNLSKGPAVRATRLQVDKERYGKFARSSLAAWPNLKTIEGFVEGIVTEEREGKTRATGVILSDGRQVQGDAVVVTTGTFLGGILHTGTQKVPGGRADEAPANQLSEQLRNLGFTLHRLKTGTPPRLHRSSLDYSKFEAQGSESPFPRFTAPDEPDQPERLPHVDCHIAHTHPGTHELIRQHLHESPMFSGQISGIGPRYCPSIEDKVVRFEEREQHLIFLEPEGLESDLIYPNGISTSLPSEVQLAFVRTIRGLEKAEIVRPGYAVEYDAVDARALDHGLASKDIDRLYFAGQINGTSGYEEAGIQGLIAGANAALRSQHLPPWSMARDEGYGGVLVDDLVTQGCDEPYRMFTSRAEYRLILREDNVEERLSKVAATLGLIDASRRDRDLRRQEQVDQCEHHLKKYGARDPSLGIPDFLWARAEAKHVYAGYIDRQRAEADRLHGEGLPLAVDLDYLSLPGLSHEAAHRLAKVRPTTTSQAARIPGMTHAALTCLWVHARNQMRRRAESESTPLVQKTML